MPALFSLRHVDDIGVARLEVELGLPHFIATTLYGRGYKSPELARAFLNPSLETDWENPYDIPGLSAVADALEAAVRAKKRIMVYGDFDLDGISATTVLTRGLRALGAFAIPFIPRRFDEGYGMSGPSIERLLRERPDFLVTVDCGIASRHEVEQLRTLGIEVAITDHHEAADLVPQGVPVADPKLEDSCKSAVLAGVGVALKLVQAIGSRMGFPYLWRSYTDFAALGTVADLMPMIGENRALVADGLARINESPRPCIAALLDVAGISDRSLTATNLSFSVIPRLNAAGRMGDAELALHLLLSDSFAEAHELAEKLEAINDDRRAIELELSEAATEQARENYHGERAIIVAGRDWHEGVKGIVASRLATAYGVPALLFTINGDEARGSGRSVGDVNLFAAVESAADLTTRFGGHEAAVGVTLPAENLEEFRKRLCAYMDALPAEAFHPSLVADAVVDLSELTIPHVEMLDKLAPFGQENPQPLYVARNVSLRSARAVGADKNHFSCVLTDGRADVSAIMFHCKDIDTLLSTETVVDAVFNVQIDEWRGKRSVKAMLEVLCPAKGCDALVACLASDDLCMMDGLYTLCDNEAFPDVTGEVNEASETDVASAVSTSRAETPRSVWEARAQKEGAALIPALIEQILGSRLPHASQELILNRLAAGSSLLGVMATGRGKTLAFETYAAWRALLNHEASLFVYPLRALIADQAFHLAQALAPFGIAVQVVTGETSADEREAAFAALNDGSADIVLTTPEFLAFHADEFAACGRIGFVAIDEAHHIGLSSASNRPAYRDLGEIMARLGDPRVLAVTATAPDNVADRIDGVLSLEESVIDETLRDNLILDDQRNIISRDEYLTSLIATGEKSVVYVNSREHAMALARMLRRRVPQLAPLIGFYHAGLSRTERQTIENMFRRGALAVLVATSAFGEGIDIPDIRHVVLYHLPFNEVELNQMAGRAGRDGLPAEVHLLFGRDDRIANENLLAELAPSREMMARLYRHLRTMQRKSSQDFFAIGNRMLASMVSDERHPLSPLSAGCGVAVFRELGLIETKTTIEGDQSTQWVRVVEDAAKVELTDSDRYREGIAEQESFESFCDWVLRANYQGILDRVIRPIVPRIWMSQLR